MQALLQLSNGDLEPLDLPLAAWPALHKAGWRTLEWTGDWYGQPVQGHMGLPLSDSKQTSALQTFELRSGAEVRLRFQLLHGHRRGEQRLFATQLAQVFVLLVETRLRERTGALSAALAERARLSLYLQHDMRNLTQWVNWVSGDFASAQTQGELLSAATRLHANAPLAQERAQRLNAALGKSAQSSPPRNMSLRVALEQAAQLAGIEMDIEGEAVAWIAPHLLARALDNVLSNLATDWRQGLTAKPQAMLTVGHGTGEGSAKTRVASLVLLCALPSKGMQLAPERLFEPFASGRPGGLGLGLYQARKSLQEAGGALHASVVRGRLRFELLLPHEPGLV